jgi:hypothetical protein
MSTIINTNRIAPILPYFFSHHWLIFSSSIKNIFINLLRSDLEPCPNRISSPAVVKLKCRFEPEGFCWLGPLKGFERGLDQYFYGLNWDAEP